MSVLPVFLAATFSLMNPVDWEPGRFVPVSNGLFSVTGHGNVWQQRRTRERYAVVPGESVVFEAETCQPPDYDGTHAAEFWFDCYDADGRRLNTRGVSSVVDSRLAAGADGWRCVRIELKGEPKGTASVCVGSACGASKYGKTPHTYLRKMRLSGVAALPPKPATRAVTVRPGHEVRIACTGTNTSWRLVPEKGVPLSFGLVRTARGWRVKPFDMDPWAIDYAVGPTSNCVFSARSDDRGILLFIDDNYLGCLAGCGRVTSVIDLTAGEGAVVTQRDFSSVAPHCDRIDFGGFDLAKATKKNEKLVSFKAMTNSCVRTVPCEQYTRAFVTCAIDSDPKKDRAFTLRLSRYNDVGGHAGRGFSGMAQTLVEFDTAKKTKVGNLWRVEVPLKLGQIPDIVFTDPVGTTLAVRQRYGLGRYLDLELLGRTHARHLQRYDDRMNPKEKCTSAVTVYGVELERPACEMTFFQTHPGNVFADDDVPETGVELRVKRPGDYRLDWRIEDAEGREAGRGSRNVTASGRILVPLAQDRLGWYGLTFTLSANSQLSTFNSQLLFAHDASFALLGRDTRTMRRGEGPYMIGPYNGAHYTCGDFNVVGELVQKIGARRCYGADFRYSRELQEKFKVAPSDLRETYFRYRNDPARLKQEIRRRLDDCPFVNEMLIFHESYPWCYTQAPEMTGQQPTEKFATLKDKPEWRATRYTNAMEVAQFFRTNFPQVKICLGNTMACTELIGSVIRDGFPEEYADYMGLEVLNRCTLPEKLGESNIQSADYLYQTASAFGYKSWKVNNMFESNYRTASIIGEDRAAAWYARDFLLSQLWRFPDINLGNLEEVGNDYANGFWGQAGHCLRYPYHYPKKSYVTAATVTKLLDGVRDFRHLETGDPSVFAVEFVRRDGTYVTAFWTAMGTAPLTVDLSGGTAAWYDAYGRGFEPRGSFGNLFRKGGSYAFTADDFVRYLVTDRPAVARVAVKGRRDYAATWNRAPAGGRIVADPKTAPAVTLKREKDPLLEKTTGLFLPYRTLGNYALRTVTDEEEGPCWELELVEPDLKLPLAIAEYAVAEFAEPIPLTGDPGTVKMRVKGNGGFGLVHWVVEDANGVRRISCGDSLGCESDPYDAAGRTLVAFTGWNEVSMKMTDKSSIFEEMLGPAEHQWQSGTVGKDGTFRKVGGPPKLPLKLVGFAFSAWNRPLFLEERKPFRQIVRFGRISVCD